jgi:hypothetical protein
MSSKKLSPDGVQGVAKVSFSNAAVADLCAIDECDEMVLIVRILHHAVDAKLALKGAWR